MSLFRIAWRSIQHRGLASLLTALSMALGVMMVVAVLSVHGVVAKSFHANSSLGYNLIVGAKGGRLQLTMNTVYYLSQPIENVPYDFYLEFKTESERKAVLERSLQAEADHVALESLYLTAAGGLPASAPFAELAASIVGPARQAQLDAERDGIFAGSTAFAIPLCLGDYFGRFRVVGTTPDMFDMLTFGETNERQFEFAEGRNFETVNDEHGFFEAVVGSTVAREKGIRVGDEIAPSHADPEGEQHADTFTVVGILKPSGTPNDRAVFINIEGFYLMENHSKPLEGDDEYVEEDDEAIPQVVDKTVPLAIEQREVTAILVRTTNDIFAIGISNAINEGPTAQCVQPVREITILFNEFVGPVQMALLTVTALICVVSGISILVSIYNSMNDRKHEIAVMRALGANRGTVMTVILLESILLSMAGGMAGWVAGHALNVAASDQIEARTGVSVGFFSMAPPMENLELPGLGQIISSVSPEILLVPALILLAIVVGFLPAVAAYKTDVAKSLGA